jgi:hypothetical protein
MKIIRHELCELKDKNKQLIENMNIQKQDVEMNENKMHEL